MDTAAPPWGPAETAHAAASAALAAHAPAPSAGSCSSTSSCFHRTANNSDGGDGGSDDMSDGTSPPAADARPCPSTIQELFYWTHEALDAVSSRFSSGMIDVAGNIMAVITRLSSELDRIVTVSARQEAHIVAQDTHIVAQDTRSAAQEARSAALEAHIVAQDTRIAAQEARSAAQEAHIVAQDTRIAAQEQELAAYRALAAEQRQQEQRQQQQRQQQQQQQQQQQRATPQRATPQHMRGAAPSHAARPSPRPSPQPPAPGRTYAAAAAGSQPRSQHAACGTAQRRPMHSGLLSTAQERLQHILQVPAGTITAQGRDLPAAAASVIKSRVPGDFQIADCQRMASHTLRSGTIVDRYLVKVTRLWEAENLVRGRCRLKGSGITLFDVLTAEERRIHQRLLPRYHREVAAGSTAQFHRARLFVNHREAF